MECTELYAYQQKRELQILGSCIDGKASTPVMRDFRQAQAEATQMQSELVKQAGQFASAPAMDPSKNPEAIPAMQAMAGAMGGQPPQPQE